ncbi:MAG TPA: hypothetical protein VIJ62_04325 [Rhizomicrobium sp.]
MNAAKTSFLAVLVFSVGSLPAVSATAPSGSVRQIAEESSVSIPAIHLKNNGMTILIKRGNGRQGGQPIALDVGDTFIGTPSQISCESDFGCEISITAMVQLLNTFGEWAICSTVDDVPAKPRCPQQNFESNSLGVVGNLLQSFSVAKGVHTLQTYVFLGNPGHLGVWEVNYTLYER